MIEISTTVTTEQAGITEDVTITSTGSISIGSSKAPSSDYAANLQFDSDATLYLDGEIETYLTYVNLGVMFGKISGGTTYYDGVITFGSKGTITVVADNSDGYNTASGVFAGNITFDAGIGSKNEIVVQALASAETTVTTGYANATGIYASGLVSIENEFAGAIEVTAEGAPGSWADAIADGIYALGGVYISDFSGDIVVVAEAGDGQSGEATATGITAGSKSVEATVTIDGFSGEIEVEAVAGYVSGTITGSAVALGYGVYGSAGVTIYDFTGDISVDAEGGIINSATGIAYSQAQAFGIYSYTGDITITGGSSKASIYVTASAGDISASSGDDNAADGSAFAAAIYTHGSAYITDFQVNIRVTAEGAQVYGNEYGKSFAEAYGIYAAEDITISGSGRIIVSASPDITGGWAYGGSIATGIYAGSQILDSDIGYDITVSASGLDDRMDVTADAYGIIAMEGILNTVISGDITVSSDASDTAAAPAISRAYGIYCKERTFGNAAQSITITGSISVNAVGANYDNNTLAYDAAAYAIYAGYVNIDLYGSLSATTNGKEGYAIYVDNAYAITDRLALHSYCALNATAELSAGNNLVYLYQDVTGLDQVQATGGTISLYMSFGDTISANAMATSTQMSNIDYVYFYVDTDAISSIYNVISGDASSYVKSSYSVVYDGTTYTVAHDTWTTLGSSDYSICIFEDDGILKTSIIVGDSFLGAGITSATTYSSDVACNVDGLELSVVAGGGKITSSSATVKGNIDIDITDSTVTAVYGSNSSATGSISVSGNINITSSDSTLGVLFGGGIGAIQTHSGSVNISLTDTVVTGAIYGAGAANFNSSSAVISVDLNNCDVSGYIYGGTVSISTTASGKTISGSTLIDISDSDISAQIYGGSRLVASANATSTISKGTKIVIDNSEVSNYTFGGGMAWATVETATVTMTVNGGVEIICTDSVIEHEIYGGGYAVSAGSVSSVNGGTSITLSNTSVINVYGGGYNAGTTSEVTGGTSIIIGGDVTVGSVYGGGNGTGDSTTRSGSVVYGGSSIVIDVTGSTGTTVSIENIYGGGNAYTTVYGGSYIEFSGNFFNNTLDFTGVLSGSGKSGSVDGDKVLAFTDFVGVLEARVTEFTKVSIDSSSEVIFTREYAADDLLVLSYDLTDSTQASEPLFTLANGVSGWSSDLVISIMLSSETIESGSIDLLLTEVGSLDDISGLSFEIYYDDSLVFSGLVDGDSGAVGDFELALNVSDNMLSLDIAEIDTISAVSEVSNTDSDLLKAILA